MFAVNITFSKLKELRKLADWQLREAGFEPESVTTAWLGFEREHYEELKKDFVDACSCNNDDVWIEQNGRELNRLEKLFS